MSDSKALTFASATPELQVPPQSRLFWGVVTQWTAMSISILLGLTITPVIIRSLGTEPYGLWGLAGSFVGFYGLFDFGLSSAISRFLGNAMGARNLAELNRVASTGRCLLSTAAGLLIVAAVIAMEPAQSILRIPVQYIGQFRALVLLSITSTGLSMVMAIYGGALLASEDFVFLNVIRVSASLVRSFGSLAAVLVDTGVVGLATVNVVVTVLEQSCLYARCRFRLPQMEASLSHFQVSAAKALFGFASMTFLVMMADTVRSRLDVMLVTRFSGLGQAGLYSVGLSAFMCFFRAVATVAGIGWPRLNRLAGSNDVEELKAFFSRISHLSAACACLLSGGFIGLAPVLIRLWVGPGYEAAATVVQILTAGFVLDIATNPGIGSLYATGRQRYFAGQAIAEALMSFSLAYLLGSRFGMVGVPLGVVSSIVITKVTIQPWYVCHNLQISLRDYWLRNVAATGLGMVLLAGGLVLARRLAGHGLLGLALLAAAGAGMLACGMVWGLILDPGDRAMVIARTRRGIRKLTGWRMERVVAPD